MMHTNRPTLLVVDDDCDVLEISCALLRHFGFAVVPASDPREALHLLRNNQEIHGVVSDFRMPVMNGEELARAIKTFRPEVPVFILSGTYPPELDIAPWDGWFQKGSPITALVTELNAATKCELESRQPFRPNCFM
jgi:CheY-like chemotaxis protein